MTGFVHVIGTRTQSGSRTYVGWAIDPARRLEQHNMVLAPSQPTASAGSFSMSKKLETRAAAMSREWHLKRDHRFRRRIADDCSRS